MEESHEDKKKKAIASVLAEHGRPCLPAIVDEWIAVLRVLGECKSTKEACDLLRELFAISRKNGEYIEKPGQSGRWIESIVDEKREEKYRKEVDSIEGRVRYCLNVVHQRVLKSNAPDELVKEWVLILTEHAKIRDCSDVTVFFVDRSNDVGMRSFADCRPQDALSYVLTWAISYGLVRLPNSTQDANDDTLNVSIKPRRQASA
jgi:hypothetical protein